MSKNNGHGVLLGVLLTVVIVAVLVFGWLYGTKIKQDLKDKLNGSNQTGQQQKEDSGQNQENSNLYITLKI